MPQNATLAMMAGRLDVVRLVSAGHTTTDETKGGSGTAIHPTMR